MCSDERSVAAVRRVASRRVCTGRQCALKCRYSTFNILTDRQTDGHVPRNQWRSHCGCRGCPDTPKIQVGGVRHPQKKLIAIVCNGLAPVGGLTPKTGGCITPKPIWGRHSGYFFEGRAPVFVRKGRAMAQWAVQVFNLRNFQT